MADALIMLGLRYGSPRATHVAQRIMARITHAAYRASITLAKEKGPFPLFDHAKYLQGEFVRALPEDIRDGIRRYGIRNSHLTAIAPTGTISLLAGNVSSGIEPVYGLDVRRRMRTPDGHLVEIELRDYACSLFRSQFGEDAPLPPTFVCASDLGPAEHLETQGALQPYVDNAISKTINVAKDIDFEAFCEIYRMAYLRGVKGCTVFRPNGQTDQVLRVTGDVLPGHRCCASDRAVG